MSLKEIASISGKPGLYKVVKPTRTGIILETIDDTKKKLIANANSRVSLLKEISIYTISDSIQLEEVFVKIKDSHDGEIETPNDEKGLYSFLKSIIEDYDTERVYPNDIKKLILWYNILQKYYPELLEAPKEKKKTPTKKQPKQK